MTVSSIAVKIQQIREEIHTETIKGQKIITSYGAGSEVISVFKKIQELTLELAELEDQLESVSDIEDREDNYYEVMETDDEVLIIDTSSGRERVSFEKGRLARVTSSCSIPTKLAAANELATKVASITTRLQSV